MASDRSLILDSQNKLQVKGLKYLLPPTTENCRVDLQTQTEAQPEWEDDILPRRYQNQFAGLREEDEDAANTTPEKENEEMVLNHDGENAIDLTNEQMEDNYD